MLKSLLQSGFALLWCATLFAQSSATDLRGTWRWHCCRGNNSGTFQITLQNPDGTFSGQFGNTADDGNTTLSGRITTNGIEFTRAFPGGQAQTWKAQLSGSSSSLKMINGKWSGYGFAAGYDDFQAERTAAPRPTPQSAGSNLRGTWRWGCCSGHNSGTFQITMQNQDGSFSGKFGNTPDDGNTNGIEFTRAFPGGQAQTWKAQLSGSSSGLRMINGKWSGYGFAAGYDDFHAEKSAPQ